MVRAYELLAEACDYPLHLGVTEAGPAFQGTINLRLPSVRCSRRALGTRSGSHCQHASRRGQGRDQDLGVPEPAAAASGDRVLPLLRTRSSGCLQARRRGNCWVGGARGAASGRRNGLCRQRTRRGTGGRSRCRLRQRQGTDLRPWRGDQDREEADIVETLIDEAMRLAESMPAGDGVPEVSVR